MTTARDNSTQNMTPAEAAHLLAMPEEGHQAAPEHEAARRLTVPSTRPGQADAKEFSGTAATQGRELRKHCPLPEPDRTPGAPHPDPFLAARGWHVNQHGIYSRRTEQPQPLHRELEAEL